MLSGILKQRYKRFFADVLLDTGELVTAHCPNTGSMTSCISQDIEVLISHNPDPKRKLHYTLELIKTIGGYINVNTHRPNKIARKAITLGLIPELHGYANIQPEVKYGENSKIDLLLTENDQPNCFVEIKNVTLYDHVNDRITFPDAVTTRGQKHLQELANVASQGKRAVMLYLVNRPEGAHFDIARTIDPKYGLLFDAAIAAGVEALAYRVRNTRAGNEIEGRVRVQGL